MPIETGESCRMGGPISPIQPGKPYRVRGSYSPYRVRGALGEGCPIVPIQPGELYRVRGAL